MSSHEGLCGRACSRGIICLVVPLSPDHFSPFIGHHPKPPSPFGAWTTKGFIHSSETNV